MNKRGFVSRILQNFRKPEGFFGRMILWGMNTGHASLAQWGMSCLQWQPEWSVLDIGCGGGANLLQILQRCPQGKAYGIDISSESVTFARKKNKKYLGTRCFIEQGGVHRLPYPDYAFDAVTAFETVYFWGNLQHAFTEVARVLKPGGSFLICCEISDPANKAWTGLVEGMEIHSCDELKAILSKSGFTDTAIFRTKKEELCLVSHRQTAEIEAELRDRHPHKSNIRMSPVMTYVCSSLLHTYVVAHHIRMWQPITYVCSKRPHTNPIV